MKKIFIIFLFLMVICQTAYGQTRGHLNNPLEIGTSAKVIGLGGAFCGVADDANAIFTNPAGIGLLESFDITTMYAKLIGEYRYMTFGLAFPTRIGSFGFGYVDNKVTDIPTTIYNNGRVRQTGSISAGESMSMIGYAYGNQIPAMNFYYALGLNFKYYRQYVSTTSRSAFGIDFGILTRLDLSHKFKVLDEISFGANLSNIYPIRMSVAAGVNDVMPFQPRLGVGINMFNRKLLIACDYYDSGLHLGAEFQIHPLLVGRIGVNERDLVFGLGLRVDEMTAFNQDVDFEFDYAYQFNQTPMGGDNTNFVSMTFQGIMKKPYIRMRKPTQDAFITDEKTVVFEGKCRRRSFITIFNNGNRIRDIETESNGFWRSRVILNKGKNIIQIFSGKRVVPEGRGVKEYEITYTPPKEEEKKGYF